MSIVAAELIAEITVKGAEAATAQIEGLGGVVGHVGGALATFGVAAAGALVGIGAESVKMAGDFQQSLTQLVTGAGESQKNLQMVSDGILNIAVATGTSTKQLTEGMYQIESAGFHGAQGLDVLKAAAEGAKAGNAQLGTVAQAVTTVMTDYAKAHLNATQATNALIATEQVGKTHLEDLSRAMGTVLPLASAAGLSFEQVAGGMAVMTNAGMTAQRAAQTLAFAIRNLEAPSSKAVSAMDSVGLKAQDLKDALAEKGLSGALQMIEEHVGAKFPAGSVNSVEAFKAILGGAVGYNAALMLGGEHMKSYEADIKSIGDALHKGGSDVEGFALVQQNFNFKLDQAKEAINVLMIRLGTALLPVLGQVLTVVTPLITRFSDWITSSHGLTNEFGLIGQTLAPLGRILSQIGDAFNAVFVPVHQLVQATAPLRDSIAATTYVFNQAHQATAPLRDSIDAVVRTFNQAHQATAPLRDSIAATTYVFNQAHQATAPLRDSIDAVVRTFNQLHPAIHQTTQAANPFLSLFRMIKDLMMTVGDAVRGIGNNLQGLVGPFQQISGIVGGVFQQHMKTASEIIKDLSNWFKTSLLPAIHAAMPAFQALGNTILTVVIPGLLQLWVATQVLIDKVLPPLARLIEALIPVMIQLASTLATILSVVITALAPAFALAALAISHIGDALILVIGIVTAAIPVVQAIASFLNQWRGVIEAVSILLTTFFAPALILTGVQAMVAGARIAASFVASLIQAGVESVVSAARITANFVASLVLAGDAGWTAAARIVTGLIPALIETGAQAVVNAAKVTGAFIASMVESGTAAVVNGAKVVASFVASLIVTAAQAVATAAVVSGQFIVSLVETAVQAFTTGSIVSGSLVPALIATIVQATIAAVTAIPALVAGFIAWASAAAGAAIATTAATWPILAIGALIALVVAGIITACGKWGAIGQWLVGVWQGVQGFFQGFVDSITGGASHMQLGVTGSTQQMSGSVQAAFASMENGSLGSLNGMTGTTQRLFDEMKAAGESSAWEMDASVRQAFANVASYIDAANARAANAAAAQQIQQQHLSPGIAKNFFAEGTSFAPGGMAVVGERGPELMYVPRGAQIIPVSNPQLRAATQSQPTIIVQPPAIYLDGKLLTNGLMPHIASAIRYGTGVR